MKNIRMRTFLLSSILIITGFVAFAQYSTAPTMPISNQEMTITFNSAMESRLGYFTGDLYAHTGVGIEGKGDWQKVIGTWGQNATQPKFTNKGNGIYELKLSPNINSFYGVGSSDVVTKICMVIRSSDGSKQTNDWFIEVFQPGIRISIQSPQKGTILNPQTSYVITANSTESASLTLKVNGTVVKQATGTTISANYIFTETGNSVIVATAQSANETATDTATVFVRSAVVEQKLPAGSRKGISYIDNTTARLVLWAPKKEFVYLIGDFNNWAVENAFQMKKDGDFFWLELSGLEQGKEYAFQYFVDGKIRIADPYTAKTCDPTYDANISSSTYAGLKAYPAGKTEGITAVLQTAQQPYNWSNATFEIPSKEKMIIYELHVRDFSSDHSYKAVIEKLDYLEDLRVNVLELMPVNEFEGNSSWGYNPAFYFAADKYYGPANDLKKLVDECHKRGIAVVIDMVLNHSYGQSPFVQLYMDNWTVTADNPWYNKESNFKNTSLTWGYDFNHESAATRELVDSINSYWLNEFNVDGFRFDFTKGFSNTPYSASSWGSEYDAARISNLKRMTDEIWKRKAGALVICEHLADNSEEKVLANYGLMLWGNMNSSYGEAAMGYNESNKSDISWGYFDKRGWSAPNLVTYQESHDEERLAYKCQTWGNVNGNYNIKILGEALNRLELNALFHLPIPGPKMIWQFGELGYDIPIDQNGRVGEKPIKWDYLNVEARTDLFKVMASLNHLKQNYDEFSGKLATNLLTGAVKSYTFSSGNNHVVAVGNFDVVSKTTLVKFPITGKWYNYFGKTTFDVTNSEMEITLAPGEYLLLSTREFSHPQFSSKVEEGELLKNDLKIYPNPVNNVLYIDGKGIEKIEIYNVSGKKVISQDVLGENEFQALSTEGLIPGIYILRATQDGKPTIKKMIRQ